MLLVELTIRPFFAQSPKTRLDGLHFRRVAHRRAVPCAFTYCTSSGRRPASSEARRMARSAPSPDGVVMWKASAVAP